MPLSVCLSGPTCEDGALLRPHDEVVDVTVREGHAGDSNRAGLFVLQLHGLLQQRGNTGVTQVIKLSFPLAIKHKWYLISYTATQFLLHQH